MLGPWVVAKVETLRWRTSLAAARLMWFGASWLVLMTLWPILPVFVIGSIIAMTTASAAIPLMTQIYQENYPERERGKTVLAGVHDPDCFCRRIQRNRRPLTFRTHGTISVVADVVCFCVRLRRLSASRGSLRNRSPHREVRIRFAPCGLSGTMRCSGARW
jgi:hypothetical protein